MKELLTRVGAIPLPAFFPDATYGAIRATPYDLTQDTGLFGMEMNSFHLSNRPGSKTVKQLGGLHSFTGYRGAILTDSGGFQLYSMISENPDYGEIRDNEIIFRPDRGREKVIMTPEKSIQTQMQLGSDILMTLDLCTAPDDDAATQIRSVELTIKWAKRCREEFDRLTRKMPHKPLLFGIVQGGGDAAMRMECGRRLEEIGFDGYGFGGWPLDSAGQLREDVLQMAADAMPDEKIKYAMGLGRPEEIVRLVEMGYSLFDCVIPTREARHQRLYTFLPGKDTTSAVRHEKFYGFTYILDDRYARDDKPVDETCDCPLCRAHSRAFLHHLFKMGDGAAQALATAHNLRFYGRLMELLRNG